MTKNGHRYSITRPLRAFCARLGVPETRILARMGLSADFLNGDRNGVDAATFFDMWSALTAEKPDGEWLLDLARSAAHGSFTSELLAFSCSPTIALGLQRLAQFKPLVVPLRLDTSVTDEGFAIRFRAPENGPDMPAAMATFDVIFFLECCRVFSGVEIVPLQIDLPDTRFVTPEIRAFLTAPIVQAPEARLIISHAAAELPLISENTAFYALIEQELLSRLHALETPPVSVQVRNIVIDLLPSGEVSMEAVSKMLRQSRRSLQRYLKSEGKSFQAILNETRAELAMAYLSNRDLNTEEISFLLAFRDPNSFYRAFQVWTGMTPLQARARMRG
jgi:AraC-like DNA-binding protein